MEIPGLAGLAPRALARRTWAQVREDDVLTYAGSLAYHGMLALFPFLIFLLSVATFLDLPQLLEGALGWAEEVLPPQAMEEIRSVLDDFQESGGPGLLSLGILGAIWAASGGVRAAMTVLNRAYDVEDPRTAWKRYLLSLGYTIALAALVLAGSALMLMGPQAVAWALGRAGLGDGGTGWWTWGRYPVAVALLVLAAGVAYSVLPNTGRFRWLTPGAVLAVLAWIALSVGFRVYVANFGRYNVLYGSVGAVIVLLLYLWLSSVVLLVGGEVNAVVDRRGDERGRSRPSGEGAGDEPGRLREEERPPVGGGAPATPMRVRVTITNGREDTHMGRVEPFEDVEDLPEEEVSGYSTSQRVAFKQAWNRAAAKGKERRVVLEEAHIAAKQKSNGNT